MLSQIKILLVDDHSLIRDGIKAILSAQSDMEVIGEVMSGEEAVIFVRQSLPDVILMDISMDGMGGIEATRRILQLDLPCKVIMLTIHKKEPFLTQMANIGAHGYITKGCPAEELYDAIRTVKAGQYYLQKELSEVMNPFGKKNDTEDALKSLSSREMEIFMLIVNGKKNSDMADCLNISIKTVSTYRTRIFTKLAVNNDVELTLYAMDHGLLNGS